MDKKQFVCLSGLPRSGSTLLSAILSQNPKIHSEGNSSLYQIMFDIRKSCETSALEQLRANNKEDIKFDLLKAIPYIYYKDVDNPIIVDKSRVWTFPQNQDLYKLITDNPKTIVLVRPMIEIVRSFVSLYLSNNYVGDCEKHMVDIGNWQSLTDAINGAKTAKKNNKGEFLFITYEQLLTDTADTINKIYSFCEWDSFDHDFNNIINIHPENDEVYKLKGMHDVRPTISKRNLTAQLTPSMVRKCKELDFFNNAF
jgi:sulfotransferase